MFKCIALPYQKPYTKCMSQ